LDIKIAEKLRRVISQTVKIISVNKNRTLNDLRAI